MVEEREWIAALVLRLVEEKNFSPRKALDSIIKQKKNSKVRATSFALVIETIKRLNFINRIINETITKTQIGKSTKIKSIKNLEPKLKNLLRIFVYRMKFENHPPELIFNTSKIILSQKKKSIYLVKKFDFWLKSINSFKISEFIDKIEDPIEQMSLKYFQTYFFTKEILRIYQTEAEEMLSYLTTNSPTYIRLNKLKDIKDVFSEFEDKKIEIIEDNYMSDVYKVIKAKIPPARLDAIKNGNFYIQSRTSAIISYLLNPSQNDIILDCCAAPGSKTSHIASMTGDKARIFALEIDVNRIKTLSNVLTRLNVSSVNLILGDAMDPPFKKNKLYFDKILVDPPCSGTGTLAVRPHTKWRIKKSLIKKYSTLQKKILLNIADLLKLEGILVYSTCSILHSENEDVISYFLENRPDFIPITSEKLPQIGEKIKFKGIRFLPHKIESEGFTIFILKRTKSK